MTKTTAGSGTGDSFFSLENFLLFCSRLYYAGIVIRNFLYQYKIFRTGKLPCFVISIGNIVAGGTGKTPMTMCVARMVGNLGYKSVIITRGYHGTYEKPRAIVSDGRKIFLSVSEAGDEAYMMAENLDVPVIVGKNRYNAGILAIKRFNPDVIILDDAFQHIALKRDLDLVLCDFNRPFGNLELIPRGKLREKPDSLLRSDAVILTRWNGMDKLNQDGKNAALLKRRPLFHASHSAHVADSNNCQLTFDGKDPCITGFLFSGIADNTDFKKSCGKLNISVKGSMEYPDHHRYTEKNIKEIHDRYLESRADFLVTTQKDYVKIKELISAIFPSARLIVIGVKIKFKPGHEQKFKDLIKKRIEKYMSDRRPAAGLPD